MINNKQQVVVSMTSFPAAITYAAKAVRYILEGSVLPDKLVLYLTYSQFDDCGIPEELTSLAQTNPVFEIRNYDIDIRSYRKLIPALTDFPEAIIVTVDDDVAYHRHWLRELLDTHRMMPHAVIAHRAKRIKPGKSYKMWKKFRWYDFCFKRFHVGFDNLQTGVGGVLYPPHSLKKEMMDVDLFTTIAPTTDDIWFWAAGVANGYPVVPVPFGKNKPRGLGKPGKLSLKWVNIKSGDDRNAPALKAITERYPEVEKRLHDKFSIDFDLVYLWVDGNDPKWIAKRNACIGKASEADTNCKGRYANNDELKYSLRSVEKYAPWIRRIFIVTDNQVPEWLDTSNPKIQIVDHTAILPPESLPCFNSRIIEHHLHKIPGLAEHFLYANDDMLINRPVSPATFFADDLLPIVRFNRRPLRKWTLRIKERIMGKTLSNYVKAIHNTALLVEKKYGTYYSGKTHHNIDAYLKSTYSYARNLFDSEISKTLTHHERNADDVQRNLYSYVALAEQQAHLSYVSQHTSFRFHIDNIKQYEKFKRYNPILFCMNDSQFASDDDRRRAASFLADYFPDKSAFEK